jgi:hypothetical protein
MTILKHISTSDASLYQYVENLMSGSFPEEEYREQEMQRQITDKETRFDCNIIIDQEVPVGFITIWIFDDFAFIEHFAIDPIRRSSGIGTKTLQLVKQQYNLPLVLETEPPVDSITQRRIAFYQRNGFCFWINDYVQPPYRNESSSIKLFLMATKELNPINDFDRIKKILYKEVYHVD